MKRIAGGVLLVLWIGFSQATAAPSIHLVDNGGGSASLNIATTAPGSLAAELVVQVSRGLELIDVQVNTALFDDPNPGYNPFIEGTPIGGNTTGLYVDLEQGVLFAAFGSPDLGIGVFEFLTFEYTGVGCAAASGTVAQGGTLTTGLSTDAGCGPPSSFGDYEPDGDVDIIDFGFFADSFGSVTGDARYDVRSDHEPDGDVDIIDFGRFADNFGVGIPALTVPEPVSVSLAWLAALFGAVRSGAPPRHKNPR